MGKLLRVLVIVFLLLSAAALALGWMLFAKRELLKGRTQKLEKAVIQLGATIEDEAPQAQGPADYPAKDISPVTSEIIDTPELSTFWDNYSNALEQADQPTMRLGQKSTQLMQYYKIDPATQKIERDEFGQKKTDGPGTMQEVLDEAIRKAEAQYNRLNETREQLEDTRIELVDTIVELNNTKVRQRQSLNKIEDLEEQIVQLNGEIRNLKQQIERLEEEKRELEDQIAEQKQQVALLEEQRLEDQAEIERLKKDNDDLRKRLGDFKRDQGPQPAVPATQFEGVIEPGQKGEVIRVNSEWKFVVIELTDAFLREILGDDLSGPVPGIELMLKRPGPEGEFVTKVKLLSVKKDEKLAIADVLTDWQQVPVEAGDVLFR